MKAGDVPEKADIPLLQSRGTDEFAPVPLTPQQQQTLDSAAVQGDLSAKRVGVGLKEYWLSRRGTAAALKALNESAGSRFYEVPDEAAFEEEAADAALGGDELVIDVHTHMTNDEHLFHPGEFMQRAKGRFQFFVDSGRFDAFRAGGSSWWPVMDELESYSFAEYVRCMFVESETAVAVLSTPPPDPNGAEVISNEEMAGARELMERFGGSGRILNHTVVHPTVPGEIEKMERWADEMKPAAWKCYTLGLRGLNGEAWDTGSAWMLDDEQYGLPFLEQANRLGVRNICAHKGISGLSDWGSPRDIGPVSRMYPDLNFLIYHSAFEHELSEGAYTDETAQIGVNRFVDTLQKAGVAAGSNVYADLGTTWYAVVKRPLEAAHVLGKLLLAVGEDNILWGTDGIFYGPPQSIVDAFRAFQIPEWMRAEFGYPKITPSMRAKILGINASRVYGIDLDLTRKMMRSDDLAWAREAAAEYDKRGSIPGGHRPVEPSSRASLSGLYGL
jgi:uncharacterized protein